MEFYSGDSPSKKIISNTSERFCNIAAFILYFILYSFYL